jgi:hypothetical protein
VNKTDISSFNIEELTQYLSELSENTGVKIEKYRAKQIYSFIVKGAESFDEFSTFSNGAFCSSSVRSISTSPNCTELKEDLGELSSHKSFLFSVSK